MIEKVLLSGSAEEIGAQLQKNFDRMLLSTQKWAQILQSDPVPQTGLTPKDIVWRKNKAKLYRYVPSQDCKFSTPILIIYALINKAYILDLIPGMSLVEHLVNEGFDVYLLDWGDFAWEDRNLGFGNLIYDYIARAAQKVCQISNSDDLTILGYCMGGTIASMYVALLSRNIKNLVLLSVPIDFENAGIASIWMQAPDFDADKIADTFELIPKDFIDVGVKMLRPVKNFWGTYTRLWKSIDEGTPIIAWKALNKWVNSNINMPGEVFRHWIKDLYQENKLIKNQFIVNGKKVNLTKIKANLLVMAGQKDHLVLPSQCKAALNYMSSPDKTYYEYPIGHGGLVFGNYAKKNVYHVISGWLAEHSARILI
ncbi:MAG: alpha/beta fold hydrolase [Syntrophomonadaceae bacterium]|jgi:polyhydroxyalkanoate synthase